MKNSRVQRTLLCIVMVMLSVGIASCPQVDGGKSETGFFSATPVLTLTPKQGEIQYAWTAASPNAGITYKLYFVKGDYTDIKKLIEDAKGATVTKNDAYTGTKAWLSSSEVYSAVVQAQNSGGKHTTWSNVGQARPSADPIDRTVLNAEIIEAQRNLAMVNVADSAGDVVKDYPYITKTEHDAYLAAIAAAETAAINSMTQVQIENALDALRASTIAFDVAKQKKGTKEIDAQTLLDAVNAAKAKLTGIAVAADSNEVEIGTFWVTLTVKQDYEQAIAAAKLVADTSGATVEERIAAYDTLWQAIENFVASWEGGSKIDKSTLIAAIIAAEQNIATIRAAAAAGEVPEGLPFVSTADNLAYQTAIEQAKNTAASGSVTQALINRAVLDLESAALIFAMAKKIGTKSAAPEVLRFGVISDTHIGATSRGANVYLNADRLRKVMKWYNKPAVIMEPELEPITALAIVGDITDQYSTLGSANAPNEWNTVKDIYSKNRGKLNIISVLGNHDAYIGGQTLADLFENATGQRTNAHYVLNGYHFITITAGSGAFTAQTPARGEFAPDVQADSAGRSATPGLGTNTGDVVPAGVKTWLRTQIDTAKTLSPGKPIFVFLHWPIQNTFYVSDEWYTSSFGDKGSWFANDPEVVIFGGHIHSPNNDPRSIWQDGFTSVNTVALHYFEMERTRAPGGNGATAEFLGDNAAGTGTSPYPKHPVDRSNTGGAVGEYTSGPRAQGLVVTVDGSKVKIENFDFDVSDGPTENVYRIPQTWEFDVSKKNEFPYTEAKRAGLKIKPVFDPGAAIRFDETKEKEITITFDQAKIPAPNPGSDIVHHYRFEFFNKAKQRIDRTALQWSDFMDTPRFQRPTYTQKIGGLQEGTPYKLNIYANSSLGAESDDCISVEFTTIGTPPVEYEYQLAFDNNLNNSLPHPASVNVTGSAAWMDSAYPGKKALRLSGDNYIELDTAAIPFDYNQSFNIAFWVKVESTTGSDPVLFSNKDWDAGAGNGFLFMVKGGGIRMNAKPVNVTTGRLNGGDDIVLGGNDVLNKWVHIAAVFDKNAGTNGQIRLYRDGQRILETESYLNTDLSGGMGGGQRSYLAQSMASSDKNKPLYNGGSKTNNVTFLMHDFRLQSGVLSDAEVAALTSKQTLHVTFTGPQDETITMNAATDSLSWASNTMLTVNLSETFDSYQWYLDGVVIPGETGSSLSRSAQSMSVRNHRLTVEVKKGAGLYTKTLLFTVR